MITINLVLDEDEEETKSSKELGEIIVIEQKKELEYIERHKSVQKQVVTIDGRILPW